MACLVFLEYNQNNKMFGLKLFLFGMLFIRTFFWLILRTVMIKAQLMVYGSLIVTMHLTTGTTSVRKDHMIWFEVMNEVINVRPILATLTAQNADRYIATVMINHMLHQCIWLSALLCTWHTVPTLKAKVTIIITSILAKYIPSPLELQLEPLPLWISTSGRIKSKSVLSLQNHVMITTPATAYCQNSFCHTFGAWRLHWWILLPPFHLWINQIKKSWNK